MLGQCLIKDQALSSKMNTYQIFERKREKKKIMHWHVHIGKQGSHTIVLSWRFELGMATSLGGHLNVR